jgi:cytochrome c553
MTAPPRESVFRDRWLRWSIGTVVGLLVFSFVVGFIWLPKAQEENRFASLLETICGAAGIPKRWLTESLPQVPVPRHVSKVVLTPDTLGLHPGEGSVGRGGTLALKCTMCHGARGVSTSDTPNLAGQEASSIYKELRDFQSGARQSAVMAPLVANLDEQDLKDLSAYYASLPRGKVLGLSSAPDIVATGSPMRNIAPCGSCHGAMTAKIGAPWLDPQPDAYLKSQLEAFAHGTRRNDISGQMRNVARNMTPAEIDAAVDFYASTPRQ